MVGVKLARVQHTIARIEHTPTGIHSPKQPGDVCAETAYFGLHFKCFKCLRGILQVFYIDLAKVVRDVAHVAMVFFQAYVTNVLSVSDVCCKCFILMLQK
jgi:hypothetical protein